MTSVAMPLTSAMRAHHQALRHADTEFAGDQLVPGEALPLVHLAPGLQQPCAARFVIGIAQRQQPLLDPIVQRQRLDAAAGGSSSAMVSAKSPTAW